MQMLLCSLFKVSWVHLPCCRQKSLSHSRHPGLLSLTIFLPPVLDVPEASGVGDCIVDTSFGLGECTICSWYSDQLWISVAVLLQNEASLVTC